MSSLTYCFMQKHFLRLQIMHTYTQNKMCNFKSMKLKFIIFMNARSKRLQQKRILSWLLKLAKISQNLLSTELSRRS